MTLVWKRYWMSSEELTIEVGVNPNDAGIEEIIATPPIGKKFIGQPLENLIVWMNKQGGFRMEEMDD